ncbi:hypothetical protein E2C01_034825 [Portunus trituberculatus]|uniref:Uncharacterized protein n=1 Tax=Portunus trituberculatus TaxID=210409 RepID=A0A5B7F7Z2_PORTR|nr:hypothetical protein [Portunus trituberculatus]
MKTLPLTSTTTFTTTATTTTTPPHHQTQPPTTPPPSPQPISVRPSLLIYQVQSISRQTND